MIQLTTQIPLILKIQSVPHFTIQFKKIKKKFFIGQITVLKKIEAQLAFRDYPNLVMFKT